MAFFGGTSTAPAFGSTATTSAAPTFGGFGTTATTSSGSYRIIISWKNLFWLKFLSCGYDFNFNLSLLYSTATYLRLLSSLNPTQIQAVMKICLYFGTNFNHLICNQQISLNSLSTTPSPGVDENHSRGVFCACAY